MGKWDGLIPLREEAARDRIRLPMLIIGVIHLVGCISITIGLRVLMFEDGCGSPVAVQLPLKMDSFRATGALCDLGYWVLGFSTTALSFLMWNGLMAIINSRWMHYYTLLFGTFCYCLGTFGLLIIVIIMVATGFPFLQYTMGTIILMCWNTLLIVCAFMVRPYYKAMKLELDAKEKEEKDRQRDDTSAQSLTAAAGDTNV